MPADFSPKTFSFVGDPTDYEGYRVVYRMLWFEGAGPATGRSAHFPYRYLREPQGSTGLVGEEGCESELAVMASAARTPRAEPAGFIDDVWGTHTGQRGKHWLLDNVGPHPELPAVTCVYQGSELVAIRVRRPIVFARDTGPGVQAQTIGWRTGCSTPPSTRRTPTGSRST